MNNTTSNSSDKNTKNLESVKAIRDHAMQEREQTEDPDVIGQWNASIDALSMVIKIIASTEGDETTKCITNYASQAAKAYINYLGKPESKEHRELYATALTYYQTIKLLRDLQAIETMREILEGLE